MTLRNLLLTLPVVAIPTLAAGFTTTAQAAKAAPKFDGTWSVEVITDSGTCDRAYRWSLGVRNGRVTEMGDNVADASGTIDQRGRVAMRFVRGQDVLTAKGSVAADNGEGNWTSPSRQCSGRWRAERRG
jgi:hypothetical protein